MWFKDIEKGPCYEKPATLSIQPKATVTWHHYTNLILTKNLCSYMNSDSQTINTFPSISVLIPDGGNYDTLKVLRCLGQIDTVKTHIISLADISFQPVL